MKSLLGITGAVIVGLCYQWKGPMAAAISCGLLGTLLCAKLLWHKMTASSYVPGAVRKTWKQEGAKGASLDRANSKVIASDGAKLHYLKVGRGPELVICIHGGPGYPPSEPWAAFTSGSQCLDLDRHTILLLHGRGCGQSSRPFLKKPEGANFPTAVAAMIKAVGVERAILDIEEAREVFVKEYGANVTTKGLVEEKVHLVGHSFGGFLVSLYAAEFAGLTGISSYTLVSPADTLEIPNRSNRPDFFTTLRNQLHLAPSGEAPELVKGFDNFVKRYTGSFGNIFAKSEEQLVELNMEFGKWYSEGMKYGPYAPFAEQPGGTPPLQKEDVAGFGAFGLFFSMGAHHDYPPEMKKSLRAALLPEETTAATAAMPPLLIVHGDRDLMPFEGSLQYQTLFSDPAAYPSPQQLPLIALERLANVGHFAPETPDGDFIKHFREFIYNKKGE